ncbi:hypothetical protein LINPERPRIM_LOCUS31630, partial [Linum perenne]
MILGIGKRMKPFLMTKSFMKYVVLKKQSSQDSDLEKGQRKVDDKVKSIKSEM